MSFCHRPVLAGECLEYLNIGPACKCVVDGTVGGAGHALRIIERLESFEKLEKLETFGRTGKFEKFGKLEKFGELENPEKPEAASGESGPEAARFAGERRFIGIDRDGEAVAAAREAIAGLGRLSVRCDIVRGNYADIDKICRELGVAEAGAILLDVGASSHQLDEPGRGFSYQKDAGLDMRMDREQSLSAANIVNEYSQGRLAEIIAAYGEERWAARIAEFVVKARERGPIGTTLELAGVIKAAIPKGARRDGPHPAKRTFQALRIAVNDELGALSAAIGRCADILGAGGRLCVISFHSLEDRAVKNGFRDLATGCVCPKDLPICVCGHKARARVVTRKPVVPSDAEIAENPRARSAKLRVAEML
ncbi:MAG: 16S rRNA (cytosine(1402)-N(4))-methyltransferase RsmH [Clostridiales bacterium]|jgi:16S rRNA (cytosine1402-N4)-methyltransferase|nr:16S rRNA (cytosine(1402)-N(4))-methyltransferase RsmH [Clostridiales bacterium]